MKARPRQPDPHGAHLERGNLLALGMMAQISNGVNLKMEAIFKLADQLIAC